MVNKIFLVTPTFNSAKTLECTMNSVMNQFEGNRIYYHIQDGGSADSTIEIIKAWEGKFKLKGINFSYKSEKDDGIYDAILKGFKVFKIEDDDWMGWINSDDQLTGLFSKTIDLLPSEVGFVTGMPCIIGTTGILQVLHRVYPADVVKAGLCNGTDWFYLQQEGTAFRYSVWKSSGAEKILKNYKYAGDFHLWKAMANVSMIYQTLYPLGIFNIREGQASQSFKDLYLKEMGESKDVLMQEYLLKFVKPSDVSVILSASVQVLGKKEFILNGGFNG